MSRRRIRTCAPPWSTRSSRKSPPTPSLPSRPNRNCARYYAAHQARYASEGMMTVRDYVFPPGESSAAAQAAEDLASSAPTPALLARWHASDSGKVSGEEFYFAAKIHLGEGLFEAARNLPDGGASAPIARPDGIHVLYMFKNRRPVPMDFAAARDQVLTDYRNDAIGASAHRRRGLPAQARQYLDCGRH